MNDLVFVMYNLKLKDRQVRKSIEMDDFEDVPSDDEWIAGEGTSYNDEEGVHEGEGDDGDFVIEMKMNMKVLMEKVRVMVKIMKICIWKKCH